MRDRNRKIKVIANIILIPIICSVLLYAGLVMCDLVGIGRYDGFISKEYVDYFQTEVSESSPNIYAAAEYMAKALLMFPIIILMIIFGAYLRKVLLKGKSKSG